MARHSCSAAMDCTAPWRTRFSRASWRRGSPSTRWPTICRAWPSSAMGPTTSRRSWCGTSNTDMAAEDFPAVRPATPAEPDPRQVGRYELLEKIGTGGMGIVYRGRDTVIGRPVAVKMLVSDVDTSNEARERFFREARAAGQLTHRNIITIYDFGE